MLDSVEVPLYLFKSWGIKLVDVTLAGKMLGQVLVTKQTGAEGKPVNQVIISFVDAFFCLYST